MYTVPLKTKVLSYREACEALTEQLRIGIDPVLETVVEMLEVLDNPQSSYDVIQIGGTNGKTSTSRYTAAFIQAGLAEQAATSRDALEEARSVPLVGLYTSPELERVNERIVISGEDVEDDLFAKGVSAAQAAGEHVNRKRLLAGKDSYSITQFDLLTVAALVIFALKGVKVAVLEVGMGGRWDATTATHPLITAITGVDLDHTKILGETKAQIAEEKAAIIKPGQRVFLGAGVDGEPEVRKIIEERCATCGIKAHTVTAECLPAQSFNSHLTEEVANSPSNSRDNQLANQPSSSHDNQLANQSSSSHDNSLDGPLYSLRTNHYTNLLGNSLATIRIPAYQAANIALARTIAETYLARALSAQAVAYVLEHMCIPGRFELLSACPLHIIDAAHNPQSIRISMGELATLQASCERFINVLVAMFADKDTEQMATSIARKLNPAAQIYVTQTQNERCLSASRMADIFSKAGRAPARIFASVEEACSALAAEDYLAIGTITLAGEVKTCESCQ